MLDEGTACEQPFTALLFCYAKRRLKKHKNTQKRRKIVEKYLKKKDIYKQNEMMYHQ